MLYCRALSICAVAALLAGCGSRPPIGAPGAMPQAAAIAAHADRGKSWMLPGTSSENLPYLTFGCGGTCVVSYPDGKLVGTLSGVGDAGPCADGNGNIYIPQQAQLQEYAHGGTTPLATFRGEALLTV
jgi:hypothetical protein